MPWREEFPSRVSVWGLIVLASAGTAIYLFSQQSPPPGQIPSPQTESYLVILGAQDKAGAVWNGNVKVTGSKLIGLRIWRQAKGDSVKGAAWTLSTRKVSSGPSSNGVMAENGVIVTVDAQAADITFDVSVTHKAGTPPVCPQDCFTFHSAQLPFGTSQRFLGGSVYVARTASSTPLATSLEDEDFPSMARSGDDIWLSYVQFVHGDRSLQLGQSIKGPPYPDWVTNGNFSFLARPAGGDQIFAMHYSVSSRTWTGPYPVTAAGEDIARSAVAVDNQMRAWVFYSAQRNNNFDIYARRISAGGSVSSEVRITSLPGTDLNPVAASDATGRVWVAWQGFRAGNLEILAAAQQGDAFSPETIVSTSQASDWDPAIAVSPRGDVAISWDTYDKGDYDVYVRRLSANPPNGISMNPPQAVAASLAFEARSSVAFDPQNRLWIAYETAPQRWGKDFGALDTTGVGLYLDHNIAVRLLDGNTQYATSDDLAKTLPGPPAAQLFTTKPPQPSGSFPDPSLATNRQPNKEPSQEPGFPVLPLNSFPRLAVDPEGTVYLAFRTPAGAALSTDSTTGISVGSIWIERLAYFDGARWNGPGIIAGSDGLLDNRPVIVPLEAGRLLIAQATDHRLSPPPGSIISKDTVNYDIYAQELTVKRSQQSAQLTATPPVVEQPSQDEAAEKAAADALASYRADLGTGQTYQVWRGDFHRHTEISFDGGHDGALSDAYRYMIDVGPLQWGGCCDHDNGGSREYSWWLLQKYTEAYFLGGRYTPMYNYERSVNYPEGHRNVVFAKRGIRPLPRLPLGINPPSDNDTAFFYKYLHFFGGLDAAHTTGTCQGTDWRNNDPQVETSVEIFQGSRQAYEMPNGPRSNSSSDSISGFAGSDCTPISGPPGAGYVSAALDKGYLLGFESSSDHHSTHISYTNLWVSDTSRQGVFDALSKRRVYAATDLILADVRIGNHFMGEVFTVTGQPTISVRLHGTTSFDSAVVVKDGAVVYSTSGASPLVFTWRDTNSQAGKQSYYYVRGVQTNGQVVWTSPMWVTPR
ncbi:MAG: hypothetical protein IT167_06415 [Bryobacterales bacterium]|nr:hypothetical protein [Bryobacterales bacterium]